MSEPVWVARESYMEEHAFIGVFTDPTAAKEACEQYHAEFDSDPIEWSDFHRRREDFLFIGRANTTGYRVHSATVDKRWS